MFIQMPHKSSVYLVGHFDPRAERGSIIETSMWTYSTVHTRKQKIWKRQHATYKQVGFQERKENIRVRPVPPLLQNNHLHPWAKLPDSGDNSEQKNLKNTSSVLLYYFCPKLWKILSSYIWVSWCHWKKFWCVLSS